ncbi:major facilitator superfamily domain-containing protein [Aspergillus bertholletiae]|uniref:Major facilitator superfamily domain-containing protein n=1 Tax=Aspergillus bertholletiae TaxID=1226010 RepID=A0A5N7BGG8_9EURO|nr:major facilitator superfamily domain-containing protein [Aspergillus bertholletiae]
MSDSAPRDHATMVVDDDDRNCTEYAALIGTNQEPDLNVSHKPYRRYNPLYMTLVASLIFLIADTVSAMTMAPRLAIFEKIICQDHYSQVLSKDGGVGDCKIEPVQSELALINGWREALDNIPPILVSVPYGILADRVGRKKVLLLAMVGCLLSDMWVNVVSFFPYILPLRAVWFSGLWQLIGGGGACISSMCFAMIADVCPPEMRTSAFSGVHAAVLVAELIAVPAGAALMSINAWVPIFGASMLLAMGILLACVLVPNSHPAMSRSDQDLNNKYSATPSSAQEAQATVSTRIKEYVYRSVNELRNNRGWLRNRNILLVTASFFVCQLGRQITSITLQFAAAKFHWKFDKASWLVSLRAGVNLFVLVALIPALSHILVQRLKYDNVLKDKRLTQLNGVCLVVGSGIIFLAAAPPTLVFGQTIFALGFAFSVTARSFLTGLVDPSHLGVVYTAVTTMLYGGLVIGSPLLAATLQWGLQLGGVWMGLPFLLAAAFFMLALSAVSAATF